mmetsp:Transcript_13085/g.31018  ORF Transcript_13085/g.31018 Transcript_13085/m.31018 type:complete len:425 (-) Transcript_13085:90-1364(-)
MKLFVCLLLLLPSFQELVNYVSIEGAPLLQQASVQMNSLPDEILVAYPGWSVCDDRISNAISEGANVIAWSFASLSRNDSGKASVVLEPNFECVRKLIDEHPGVTHLLSFGGWNRPHPDDHISGFTYFEGFKAWNESPAHLRKDGKPLFDGVDWDFEGNDEVTESSNVFTVELLDMLGEFSVLARRRGYLVSFAPPESYLDPRSPEPGRFSRSLLHDNPLWEAEFAREMGGKYKPPFFAYHGRNCWAYILARFGLDAFDFVSVQFYESYSRFGYDVQVAGMQVAEAVVAAAVPYVDGWEVDFSADPDPRVAGLGRRRVSIPPERLVIGLGALHGPLPEQRPRHEPPYAKVFTLEPSGVPGNPFREAMARLRREGRPLRGAMFWCIAEEAASSEPFYMSRGLAAALRLPRGNTTRSAADAAAQTQ